MHASCQYLYTQSGLSANSMSSRSLSDTRPQLIFAQKPADKSGNLSSSDLAWCIASSCTIPATYSDAALPGVCSCCDNGSEVLAPQNCTSTVMCSRSGAQHSTACDLGTSQVCLLQTNGLLAKCALNAANAPNVHAKRPTHPSQKPCMSKKIEL